MDVIKQNHGLRQNHGLKDEDIVNYSYQLLSGVGHLHRNNIVHRDIKGIFAIEKLF